MAFQELEVRYATKRAPIAGWPTARDCICSSDPALSYNWIASLRRAHKAPGRCGNITTFAPERSARSTVGLTGQWADVR